MKQAIAIFSFILFVSLSSTTIRAQSDKTIAPKPAEDEKAIQILQRATEALGGSAYLNVRTITARGLYTPFEAGQSTLPMKFIDYIVYPDKERTEFTGDGIKSVQTNNGDTGWVFDGTTKIIKVMKANQIADFKFAMRTNVDNLLRGTWRAEGAKIAYAGRREAGVAKRNEAVRVTYSDGFTVDFEFGAQDHLPAKVVYSKKKPDNDTEEIKEEDRMQKYLEFNGITAPFVIDHYRAGIQTSRINYDTIEYNAAIPDSLFVKPTTAKEIK
jgi:hypothetical protein